MKKILDETELDYKAKSKLITQYKEAPEEIKDKIKKGDIDIKFIEDEITETKLKEANKGKVVEFIPNFETRLKDFSYEVVKLEQQVAIFSRVFRSSSFQSKYDGLGSKEKRVLDQSIYGIQKRIKECYDEVEYFISKMKNVESKFLEVERK